MRLANLDAELNIPSDEWIEHHWFENTGDIFIALKQTLIILVTNNVYK